MKIKRGDSVVIVAGDDKSAAPRRVSQVLEGGRRIVVEGANLAFKHVRRGHPKSPQGGRLRLEMPFAVSNVMYYCDACQSGVRLGLRFTADGAKERFCRKCGKSAGQISPPRAARASS